MLHVFNNTEGKINVIFNRFVLNKLSVDFYIVPSRIIGFFFGDKKKKYLSISKVMIKTNKVFQVKISYHIF